MSFAIFGTGVLAFECCLSSLISAAVYGLRLRFLFCVLATSMLPKSEYLNSTGIDSINHGKLPSSTWNPFHGSALS